MTTSRASGRGRRFQSGARAAVLNRVVPDTLSQSRRTQRYGRPIALPGNQWATLERARLDIPGWLRRGPAHGVPARARLHPVVGRDDVVSGMSRRDAQSGGDEHLGVAALSSDGSIGRRRQLRRRRQMTADGTHRAVGDRGRLRGLQSTRGHGLILSTATRRHPGHSEHAGCRACKADAHSEPGAVGLRVASRVRWLAARVESPQVVSLARTVARQRCRHKLCTSLWNHPAGGWACRRAGGHRSFAAPRRRLVTAGDDRCRRSTA